MNRDDGEPVIMAGKMRRMVFKEFAFRRDMGQTVSTAHRYQPVQFLRAG